VAGVVIEAGAAGVVMGGCAGLPRLLAVREGSSE